MAVMRSSSMVVMFLSESLMTRKLSANLKSEKFAPRMCSTNSWCVVEVS